MLANIIKSFFAIVIRMISQLLGLNKAVTYDSIPYEIRKRLAIRFYIDYKFSNYGQCIRHWVETGIIELAAADYDIEVYATVIGVIAAIEVEASHRLNIPVLSDTEGYNTYGKCLTTSMDHETWSEHLERCIVDIFCDFVNKHPVNKDAVLTNTTEKIDQLNPSLQ